MDTLSLSKKLGLTPKTAKTEKDLYYKGIYSSNKLVKCKLLDIVSTSPIIVKIDINGLSCDISLDRLKEIQPSKFSLALGERPCKGKSLYEFPDSFTVIDIETTGLCPKTDSIIELAGIKVRNGKISETFEEFVNPMIHIPYEIQALTNITDKMVFSAFTIDEVLPRFLSFIGDDIVMGHNANFDVNFIYDNCTKQNLPCFSNDFVDTLKLSRKLFPNWKRRRLCDMAENLSVTQKDYHRALADCETAFLCYQEMKKKYLEHSFQE